MADVDLAWLTFLLGLTGIGATFAVIAKFLRNGRGGFR